MYLAHNPFKNEGIDYPGIYLAELNRTELRLLKRAATRFLAQASLAEGQGSPICSPTEQQTLRDMFLLLVDTLAENDAHDVAASHGEAPRGHRRGDARKKDPKS